MIAVALLLQLNIYRAQHGLSSVYPTAILCQYARERAIHISTDFSHRGFYAQRPYRRMIENLARGFTEDQIIYRWSQSPTHNANLLAPVTKVCIAKEQINHTDWYAMEGTL